MRRDTTGILAIVLLPSAMSFAHAQATPDQRTAGLELTERLQANVIIGVDWMF